MTSMKQNIKLILLGTALIIAIVSVGCLSLNSPQQPLTGAINPTLDESKIINEPVKNAIICTVNQTPGEVILLDETLNNAVICTTLNNSVTLRLPLYERVGGIWLISSSPGISLSEGYTKMSYPPGLGTSEIEWNITVTSLGVQTLNADCIQYNSDNRSIATQNLTFVVR
jgi:hypothetical protein